MRVSHLLNSNAVYLTHFSENLITYQPTSHSDELLNNFCLFLVFKLEKRYNILKVWQ